jgi:hypothetical protein
MLGTLRAFNCRSRTLFHSGIYAYLSAFSDRFLNFFCRYMASVSDSLAATPIIFGKLADGSETVVAAVIQHSSMKNVSFPMGPFSFLL